MKTRHKYYSGHRLQIHCQPPGSPRRPDVCRKLLKFNVLGFMSRRKATPPSYQTDQRGGLFDRAGSFRYGGGGAPVQTSTIFAIVAVCLSCLDQVTGGATNLAQRKQLLALGATLVALLVNETLAGPNPRHDDAPGHEQSSDTVGNDRYARAGRQCGLMSAIGHPRFQLGNLLARARLTIIKMRRIGAISLFDLRPLP